MLQRNTFALLGAASLFALSASPVLAGAFGGCGAAVSTSPGGPPSLSATEVSTTQALELIRQRRIQVAQACPVGTVSVEGICQPVALPASFVPPPPPAPAAAQPAAAPAGPAAGAAKAAPKAKAVAAAAPPKAPAPPYSKQPGAGDMVTEPVSSPTTYGSWVEGFVDFERHDDITPGAAASPDRRQRTVGYLSGFDRTSRSGNAGVQIGFLSGYMDTDNKFSDTQSVETLNNITITTTTTGARQTLEGAIVGGYGSYFAGPFAIDLLAKVELLDLDLRGTVNETAVINPCGGPPFTTQTAVTSLDGSTSVNNYTIASNLTYKFDLGGGRWWEPMFGLRYTFSDYGRNADLLGFDDGHVLRVQGGVRIGSTSILNDGIVSVSLTGLLYSDVLVDGFVASSSGLPASVAEVDEGKLRAMGILQGRYTQPNGMTYYGQIEVRGGEDVIGAGGKVGMRYEW